MIDMKPAETISMPFEIGDLCDVVHNDNGTYLILIDWSVHNWEEGKMMSYEFYACDVEWKYQKTGLRYGDELPYEDYHYFDKKNNPVKKGSAEACLYPSEND